MSNTVKKKIFFFFFFFIFVGGGGGHICANYWGGHGPPVPPRAPPPPIPTALCGNVLIACLLPVECKDSHCGLTITSQFDSRSCGFREEEFLMFHLENLFLACVT